VIPPELLALLAPFCIALGGMFSAELAGRLSVPAITRWRVLAPIPPLAVVATIFGGWATVEPAHLPYLLISGVIGMVIADSAFSAAIFTVGARIATLVFSLNAPIAALLALVLLGEPLSGGKVAGIALVFTGIAIAILYRSGRPGGAETSLAGRVLWKGVALAALSAAAQACSVIAARPVTAQNIDAAAAMSIRLGAAAFILVPLAILFGKRRFLPPLSARYKVYSVLGAVIGVGLGVTFVFAALQTGDVATVSTLASMTPIAVLPLVWLRTGATPRWPAWLGALTAFAGAAVIANN